MKKITDASDKFYDRMRHDDADNVADADPTGKLDDLKGRKYCVVVSYRKNGQAMPSPVWFGTAGGKVYFQTNPDGYKVKRIRNNPEVRVAPCDSRGKPLGPPFIGKARVVADDEAPAAERALQSNYGMGRRIYTAFSNRAPSVYVEVTPAAQVGSL